MDKKIAVLGVGAIGSCVGADVTRAGYDVVLIDQWPAHVEAMKTNGLRVTMPEEELTMPVRAFHLCDVCTLRTQFDVVLLAAKSYDSRWLAEFISPYLHPEGVLVPVQNSLNDEWVAPIVGAKWTKLISSSMLLGPLGVLGLKLWEATEVPGVLELLIRLGTESITVARALGYSIEPIFGLSAAEFAGPTEKIVEKLAGAIVLHGKAGTKVRGVSLQDYLKGRRTETECLNGLIVSKGRQAGVPTPANEAIVQIDRQIQRGVLKPARSNLALVQRMID